MTDAEINNAVGLAVMKMRGAPLPGVAYYDFTDYANSLDAIVPVAGAWCDKHNATIIIERCPTIHPGNSVSCATILTDGDSGEEAKAYDSELDRNPARALCLAFLQAVKETP